MKITFLGTGHAWGTPEVGCSCPACLDAQKENSKSRRTRTAILIELTTKERILIDCGPDIRDQLLKREQLLNELNELKKKEAKLKPLDILLISHEHTDHINGLDELQAFRRTIGKEKFEPIPIYATEEAWNEISKRFGYLEGSILDKRTIYPGISISDLPKEMRTKGIEIIPFKTYHGRTARGSVGFIIMAEKKKIIYTSDLWDTVGDYRIYEPDKPNLLIMEANWFKEPEVQPANPHMSFERALKFTEEWNPTKTYLIHMSHEEGLTHEEWIDHVKERAEGYFKRDIDANVSYDGEVISL